MSNEHNGLPEKGREIKPRGFSSKRNIIIIVIAALVVLGSIGTAVAFGVSNHVSQGAGSGFQLAEKYLSEQNYEQAIIAFEQLLEIEPMNVDAYLGLAEAYIGMDDTGKALEVLQKGLEMTGDARIQAKIDELTKLGENEVGSEPDGTITILGKELDIAKTESLLIYNKKTADLPDGYENGYNNIIYLDDALPMEELKKVAALTKLSHLSILYSGISDINALAGLTNLSWLELTDAQINDITSLAGLTNLTNLDLQNNQIGDITSLAGLTKLAHLNLTGNPIDDITPLANLTELTNLSVGYSQISDLTPVAGLTKLEDIFFSGTQISDLTPLAGLTSLKWITADYTQISDLTPLAGLINLDTLMLQNDPISDITPLAGLTNLECLWLYGDQISDITPLVGLKKLNNLNLNDNPVSYESIEWLKEKLPNC